MLDHRRSNADRDGFQQHETRKDDECSKSSSDQQEIIRCSSSIWQKTTRCSPERHENTTCSPDDFEGKRRRQGGLSSGGQGGTIRSAETMRSPDQERSARSPALNRNCVAGGSTGSTNSYVDAKFPQMRHVGHVAFMSTGKSSGNLTRNVDDNFDEVMDRFRNYMNVPLLEHKLFMHFLARYLYVSFVVIIITVLVNEAFFLKYGYQSMRPGTKFLDRRSISRSYWGHLRPACNPSNRSRFSNSPLCTIESSIKNADDSMTNIVTTIWSSVRQWFYPVTSEASDKPNLRRGKRQADAGRREDDIDSKATDSNTPTFLEPVVPPGDYLTDVTALNAQTDRDNYPQAWLDRFSRTTLDSSDTEAVKWRQLVKSEIIMCWSAYKENGWGADAIGPVSGEPQTQSNLAFTMIDSLSTLHLVGLDAEILEVADYLVEYYDPATQMSVDDSVFEIVIRLLGGLMSIYDLSGHEIFLGKAEEIGRLLLQAFPPLDDSHIKDERDVHHRELYEREAALADFDLDELLYGRRSQSQNNTDGAKTIRRVNMITDPETVMPLSRIDFAIKERKKHLQGGSVLAEEVVNVIEEGGHEKADPEPEQSKKEDVEAEIKKSFHAKSGDVLLADVGSIQLEFAALASRLRDIDLWKQPSRPLTYLLQESWRRKSPLLPVSLKRVGRRKEGRTIAGETIPTIPDVGGNLAGKVSFSFSPSHYETSKKSMQPSKKGQAYVLSVGAMGDSYYEYLLKLWIMTGKQNDALKDMWKKAVREMIKRLIVRRVPQQVGRVGGHNNYDKSYARGRASAVAKNSRRRNDGDGQPLGQVEMDRTMMIFDNPNEQFEHVQELDRHAKEKLKSEEEANGNRAPGSPRILMVPRRPPENPVFTFLTEEILVGSGFQKTYKMHHLMCFVPGMLALGVNELTREEVEHEDLQEWFTIAEELAETCYAMYRLSKSGLAPEVVAFNDPRQAMVLVSDEIDSLVNRLRPETVESLYYLHYYTGNPKYRNWAANIFNAFGRNSRGKFGYAQSLNVQATANSVQDKQESFFISETLKYMYLLFSPRDTLDITNKYVFSTEGHPLIRMRSPSNNESKMT